MAYPWDISVEEASKLVCECEREAVGYDKRIISAESADIATMHAKAEFVEITSSGIRESHVHDVQITKEAPNYHIE